MISIILYVKLLSFDTEQKLRAKKNKVKPVVQPKNSENLLFIIVIDFNYLISCTKQEVTFLLQFH
jgi:hypothetical protein